MPDLSKLMPTQAPQQGGPATDAAAAMAGLVSGARKRQQQSVENARAKAMLEVQQQNVELRQREVENAEEDVEFNRAKDAESADVLIAEIGNLRSRLNHFNPEAWEPMTEEEEEELLEVTDPAALQSIYNSLSSDLRSERQAALQKSQQDRARRSQMMDHLSILYRKLDQYQRIRSDHVQDVFKDASRLRLRAEAEAERRGVDAASVFDQMVQEEVAVLMENSGIDPQVVSELQQQIRFIEEQLTEYDALPEGGVPGGAGNLWETSTPQERESIKHQAKEAIRSDLLEFGQVPMQLIENFSRRGAPIMSWVYEVQVEEELVEAAQEMPGMSQDASSQTQTTRPQSLDSPSVSVEDLIQLQDYQETGEVPDLSTRGLVGAPPPVPLEIQGFESLTGMRRRGPQPNEPAPGG